ncbi:hypothetical protein BDW62DRAFT_198704 [Aspergillus aurantiobrunneus]
MSIMQCAEHLKMPNSDNYDKDDAVDPIETRPLLQPNSPSPPHEAYTDSPTPKLSSENPNDVDAILPISGGNRKLHILLAEHDPVTRLDLKAKLEGLGHSVRAVSNGRDCADLYRSEIFSGDDVGCSDVVFVGTTMALANGHRTAQMIRAIEQEERARDAFFGASVCLRRVPMFVISTPLNGPNRQAYIDSGFDGWIRKPIDHDELKTIIEGVHNKEIQNQLSI